jgi:hypothetical protein
MKSRLLAGFLLALLSVSAHADFSPLWLLRALVGGSSEEKLEPERVKEPATFSPIAPPKDEQHLYKAFVERQTKWLEKQFLLDFPKRNAGALWLADAIEVLRGAAFNLANGSENAIAKPDFKAPEPLVAKAKAVRAAGCDDPLFNFVTAYLDTANHGPHRDRIALAESHWDELLAGGDSPHLKMFAAGWIRFHSAESRQTKDKDRVGRMEAVLPKLVENALTAIADDEDALGFYQLQSRDTGTGPDELQLQTYLWPHHDEIRPFLDKPNVPSWLRDTIIGERAVWAAWEARGNGWAREVKQDGWKGFGEQLEIAARHLTAAWQAKPELPFAARKMITVTMGQSCGDAMLRVWFDRSTAACFDYMPAYLSLNWAYRPRWGGSHELMLAVGRAALATGRHDTFVPRVYLWVMDDISEDLSDRTSFMAQRELWKPCGEVVRGMLTHAKTETDRTYALSRGIMFAVAGHDYSTAAEFRRQLKQPILPISDTNLYKIYGVWHFEWRGILAIQTNPEAAKILDDAEADYWSHRLDAAREGYSKLVRMPEVAAEVETKDLVEQRLAAIEVEQRLKTGEWVKLSESEHQLLWRNQDPYRFEPLPGGILSEKNHPSPSTYMTARVGLDFELRAKLDNPPGADRAQFGCYLACQRANSEFATVMCGRTGMPKETADGAVLARTNYWATAENPPVPVAIKADSRVMVRFRGGYVTLWIDDVEVFSRRSKDVLDYAPSSEAPGKPSHFFGLGSPHYPKGQSQLKEIEFRRLLAE